MKCCAIIVTYNPDNHLERNLLALLPQFEEIIIVDNGSDPESRKYLDILSETYDINLIKNEENLGIATALNIGAKYGISKGYYWIATFDQDSLVPEGYLDAILNAYESFEYKDKIAIVAPTYLNEATGKVFAYSKTRIDRKLFSEVKTTITSGNLVKLSIFSDIGFFEQGFFIDYVDHEFCLRCRKNNFKIIELYDLIIIHNLGRSSIHNLFGIKITTTNHSAIRRYYKYRNRIRVYQRYCLFDFSWFLSDIKSFIAEPIKITLFEEEKMNKIYYIFKGIYHGIKGINGKYT